jgi:hypothetical protein
MQRDRHAVHRRLIGVRRASTAVTADGTPPSLSRRPHVGHLVHCLCTRGVVWRWSRRWPSSSPARVLAVCRRRDASSSRSASSTHSAARSEHSTPTLYVVFGVSSPTSRSTVPVRSSGGGQSAPDRAALLNGALVRYLDFNDSYLAPGETCHPSDNLGAVLAAAELANADGTTLLTALAVAYQVQCRLSDAAPVRQRGFDHTTHLAYSRHSMRSRATRPTTSRCTKARR